MDIAEKMILQGAGTRYDHAVVHCLTSTIASKRPYQEMLNLACYQLKDGMILMQDLRLKDGRLLLTKGTMLNRQSVQSIQGIAARNLIEEKICAAWPADPINNG